MPPVPEVAVFYSTIRGWPWGAPDYIWPEVALKLVQNDIRTIAIIHPSTFERPEIKHLIELGCECYPQPLLCYSGGWSGRIRNSLQRFSRRDVDLNTLIPPGTPTHIYINQGGDLDLVFETDLLPLLECSDTTYDIFFHLASYAAPVPKAIRSTARTLFERARYCCFNSEWTQRVVEHRLLTQVKNSQPFTYPIRFTHESALPWPQEDAARLACVSRIDIYHKGLDVLLAALQDMPETPIPWSLDIYGDGDDDSKSYLEDAVHHFGLSDQVTIHPYETEITRIWRDHHLLLLTSRHEGCGVSMLEAMACGRPVLRTPYGGAKEWIEHGVTGYLCPAPEPKLIRDTIHAAFKKFSEWEKVGKNAHLRILQQQAPTPEPFYFTPFSLE